MSASCQSPCLPAGSLLQDAASQGPSCTTASDGTCTLDVTDSSDNFSNNQVKSAVVTAAGHGPLVIPSLSSYFGQNRADAKYSGALVLDRQVVKPGDDLHVTGALMTTIYPSAAADHGVILPVHWGNALYLSPARVCYARQLLCDMHPWSVTVQQSIPAVGGSITPWPNNITKLIIRSL